MISKFLSKLFGSKHDRYLKSMLPLVEIINGHFEKLNTLSEEELKGKTAEFRERVSKGESLDDILPEAFAVVKEACRRMCGKSWLAAGQEVAWEMVPYDVQLIGGICLHQGKIAEMSTGEGKTLVAVLPVYLNAIEGKGVHVVTVNDYLAQRDSEWMGEVYNYLGLTVGCILNNMDNDDRRDNYNCDIAYGTNNEFGFDYLRDNMAVDEEELVQRGFNYAIVDEVDSVLIDEARTPLIISGPVNVSIKKYDELNVYVKRLFDKQNFLNNRLIEEAKKIIKESEDEKDSTDVNYKIGKRLLQVKLGGPKHAQLNKLFNETGMKKLCDNVENMHIRDKDLYKLEELNFFNINEKNGSADLTDEGREVLAGANSDTDLFILPDLADEIVKIDNNESLSDSDKLKAREEVHKNHTERSERVHIISQLLRAYSLFEKDVEYIVQEQKVIIIDEHTGRPMEGRRYSDGLHQAIEAKEGVKVERESQTLATITLQNYFRMYSKLAGMTGTAETEEGEFWEIYKLDVMVIPTNDTIRRADQNDVIYKTKREKYKAVSREIKRLNDAGQPVLVGTISVEVSQLLANMLKRQGVKCHVLNAKHHQNEAEVVAQAGHSGAVTIATNMAGRGTDIKLGEGVVHYKDESKSKDDATGGLRIIGTERHESRRIDRQLRGRSGRQGDPGSSKFFLSLEDDLMRLFGSDRITSIMDRFGMKDDEPIEHPWITKSVERAQKRVESRNFEIRKHLLEYDNVMNIMRKEIYKKRNAALTGKDIDKYLNEMLEDYIEDVLVQYCDESVTASGWDWHGLKNELLIGLTLNIEEQDKLSLEELLDLVIKLAHEKLEEKKSLLELVDSELFEKIKRIHILRTIDELWKDHLFDMDSLRDGINLRAYGQKDPLIEYKREGFGMFEVLISKLNKTAIEKVFNTSFTIEESGGRNAINIKFTKDDASTMNLSAGEGAPDRENIKKKPIIADKKTKPNEPCPCGSGKKFKKCCG